MSMLSFPIVLLAAIFLFAASQNSAQGQAMGAIETQYARLIVKRNPDQIEWFKANCLSSTQYGDGEKFYGIFGIVAVMTGGILVVKSIMTKLRFTQSAEMAKT